MIYEHLLPDLLKEHNLKLAITGKITSQLQLKDSHRIQSNDFPRAQATVVTYLLAGR